MTRYGILLDLNRCTGCMTCVIACKQENLTRPGVWWNKVLELESESLDRIVYFRYACMHCDNPPCVAACPEQASARLHRSTRMARRRSRSRASGSPTSSRNSSSATLNAITRLRRWDERVEGPQVPAVRARRRAVHAFSSRGADGPAASRLVTRRRWQGTAT